MHSTYGLAGEMASPGKARRVAWVIWAICVSLILSAAVIWFLDEGNLVQYVHIICIGIAFGLFGTVGALIVWQRPRNTIGWILCTVGLGTGITDFSGAYVAYGIVKGHLPLPGTGVFNWLGNTVWPVNWVLLLVFLPLLFPNGGLLTRRWRIVGWLAAILALLSVLAGWLSLIEKGIPADFWSSLSSTFNLLQLPLTIAALVSLVLRFLRAKERERQQIKWLIYGTAIMAVLIVGSIFILNDPNSPIYALIFDFAIMLLPLSIGISILRNQLYDIDRLINRTLVYATLTILLALVYVGLVIGLQALVRLFTGQIPQSPIVVVASTLAIAALFQPLRHRIQAIIDRRFYRRKYDATRTVEAFSATLRNEVDLSQLREHLLAV
ncbi:MAG TPA: hypothetical protein VF043_25430, partial [Ktedonobacteraceae bacterium]